ncbi:MAG TPA: tetratricopeptide repeat protein [Thermoanaerobaculia bacterium]
MKSIRASRLERSRIARSETDRLDSVLAASLQAEERNTQRRWLRLAVLTVLLLTAIGVSALLPNLYPPLDVSPDPAVEKEARELVQEGQKHVSGLRLDKARTELRMALKLAPRLPETWAGLASYHIYYHQLDKVEGLMRKALALNPEYLPALQILGEVALGAGREDEAEAFWRRCPDKTNLGRLYLLQGRLPEAVRVLEEEAGKAPGQRLPRELADAARSGRLTPEIRAFLLPRFPASRSPFTARGWWLLLKEERPGAAIPAFARALEEDPGNVSALMGQGWALLKAGRTRECGPWFERVLRVRPEDPVTLNGMASCLRAEGKIEEAIAVWTKMDALSPVPTSAARHLARIYYERKDCEKASTYLAKVLKRYPEEPGAAEALEDCVKKLGRRPPQTSP